MFVRMLFKGYSISARNCGMVYGLPSPSTWIGLVHALCRKAQLLPYLRDGVTPIIQRFSINGFKQYGRYNFALLRSVGRDVGRKEMNATQLDTPQAYFEGGVVFELNIDEQGKGDALDNLNDAVKFMRFAGGTIEKQDKSDKYCLFFASLHDAVKIAATTLLEHSLDPSQDILEQIITLSAPQKGRKGWFMPSLMGYRLLEEPFANREGSRKGYPHSYADPLLGIVRAAGFRGLDNIPRWRYDYRQEKKLILFTTSIK